MTTTEASKYLTGQSSNPDVLLWAVKPAEDGIKGGITIRVWNVSNEKNDFALSVHPAVQPATRTTHIETDIGPATVAGGNVVSTCQPQQLQTFRVVTTSGSDE